MHSRSSLENHTQFQTKSAKSIPVFRPKRRKNYPHWGGTFLVAYMREYPPGLHSTRHNTNLPSNLKNVALAYEPTVEKNRVSYISKNDPTAGFIVLWIAIGDQTPRTSPLDPPLHHQRGDLSKRETPDWSIT